MKQRRPEAKDVHVLKRKKGNHVKCRIQIVIIQMVSNKLKLCLLTSWWTEV